MQGRTTAMKIHIDIECTPEEARAFLGLPDVAPMQEALMSELQKRMMANMQAMEPEQLFKTWLPAGLQGWEQLQKAFWSRPPSPRCGRKPSSNTVISTSLRKSFCRKANPRPPAIGSPAPTRPKPCD